MNTLTSARRDTESAATAGPAVATPGAPTELGEVATRWGTGSGATSPNLTHPGGPTHPSGPGGTRPGGPPPPTDPPVKK